MAEQTYTITKTSFNHGLWSPNADGNFDDEKYPHSCTQLDNFIPTLQGGLKKRQGFNFEHNTDDTTYKIITSNIKGTNYLFEFELNQDIILSKTFIFTDSNNIRVFDVLLNRIVESSSIPLTYKVDTSIGIFKFNNYIYYQEKQADYTTPANIIELLFNEKGELVTEIKYKLGENNHKRNDRPLIMLLFQGGTVDKMKIISVNLDNPDRETSLNEFIFDRKNRINGIQHVYIFRDNEFGDYKISYFFNSGYINTINNVDYLQLLAIGIDDNRQNDNVIVHSLKIVWEGDTGSGLFNMSYNNNINYKFNVTNIAFRMYDYYSGIKRIKLIALNRTDKIDNVIIETNDNNLNIKKISDNFVGNILEASSNQDTKESYKLEYYNNRLHFINFQGFTRITDSISDTDWQKAPKSNSIDNYNTYIAKTSSNNYVFYYYKLENDVIQKKLQLNFTGLAGTDAHTPIIYNLNTINVTEVDIWNADTNTFVQTVYCAGIVNDFIINQNAIYLLYSRHLPQILYYDLDRKVFNVDDISSKRKGPFELSGNDDKTKTITIFDTQVNTKITSSGFNIGLPKNIGYLIKVWLDPFNEKHAPDFWLAEKDYGVGDYVYSDRSIYRCVKAGTGGKAYIPPTHTEGIRSDGDNKWEWHDCLYAYYEMKKMISDTEIEVTRIFPDKNPFGLPRNNIDFTTWKYQFDAWIDDIPELGAIMHSRLSLVNTIGTNIYFSSNDDPLNFEDNSFGQVDDTDAFTLNAITDYGTNRTFLAPCELGLIIGTNLGEKIVKKASIDRGFIPTNVDISEYSYTCSTRVKPVRVKDVIIFIQDTGKDIRAISIAGDDYYKNLSFYSGYVCKGKFTNKLAYMREQYSLILAIDDIGNMYGMLYDKMKDIYGIFRIIIGASNDYKVLDVVVDLNNIAYILALNTITNKKAIFSFGEKHKFIFDLAYEFDIAAGQTTIKAPFLYNSTGKAFLKYHNATEVYEVVVASDGTINLPSAGLLGQKVLVGLKIDAIVQTQNVEFQEGTQTTGAKTKRVNTILVDFIDTKDYVAYYIKSYPSSLNIPFTGYSYIYNDDQKTLDTNIVGEQTKDLSISIESNNHGYCEINRVSMKLVMNLTR